MSFRLSNLTEKDKVHFIGIGGVSMSGLAEILLNKNIKVSGSDMKESDITKHLENLNCEIFIGQKASNIDDNIKLVVYTAAIADSNEELQAVKEKNIPMVTRAEFLGTVMKEYKNNIAIAGTHGKTTTTSMVSHVLLEGDTDPTILVGGKLDIIGGYVRTSNGDYLVTEACEYKCSFLSFYPTVGVILNIDEDHLDFYKDIDEIEEAFYKFAKRIPENGTLVVNAHDSRATRIASKVSCNLISIGIETGDVNAKNVEYTALGHGSFDVYHKDQLLFHITLKVPGKHNILNSLSSIAACLAANIDKEDIKKGLEDFKGANRRFEFKGIKNEVTVIDDYAHHPTEIKAMIEAAKNIPHNRLICLFQPHTYTRTYTLFDEFSKSFHGVDKLILADIYAAREKDTGLVNSKELGDAVRMQGVDCLNLNNFDEMTAFLNTFTKPKDLVITVGAGDIYLVGENFLK